MRSVGARVEAVFSPRYMLLSFHSTLGTRTANGITPGYSLPLLKISIHSLCQVRVTDSEKFLKLLLFSRLHKAVGLLHFLHTLLCCCFKLRCLSIMTMRVIMRF